MLAFCKIIHNHQYHSIKSYRFGFLLPLEDVLVLNADRICGQKNENDKIDKSVLIKITTGEEYINSAIDCSLLAATLFYVIVHKVLIRFNEVIRYSMTLTERTDENSSFCDQYCHQRLFGNEMAWMIGFTVIYAFVCHLKVTNNIHFISHQLTTPFMIDAKQNHYDPQDHCMRDLQIYFRNPKELLEQYVKNLSAVLDFQNNHRQHLQKAKQEQVGSSHEFLVNFQKSM
uniref:Uncharacterized protein n=1 Tax=Onchocerca volvulus TaxID=6282 RepID=A0A8R1TYF1_ONCVO